MIGNEINPGFYVKMKSGAKVDKIKKKLTPLCQKVS